MEICSRILYSCLIVDMLTLCLLANGAKALCPISIEPPHLFLEHEKTQEVTCSSSAAYSNLTWRISNVTIENLNLVVNSSWFTSWNESMSCAGHFVGLDSCAKPLKMTIYKAPDRVSISVVNHTGPVIEGKKYKLQCDIWRVAPVEFLIVKWYRGWTVVTESRVNGSTEKNPVNVMSIHEILSSINDDGVYYRCEAELNMGPEAPHTVSVISSDPVKLNVHYKPAINTRKLPSEVPVFRGYPETLVCEAQGQPPPTFTWTFNNDIITKGGNLTIMDTASGTYNCTATNSIGSSSVLVHVVAKEDYLPLIAGFVALAVVTISIIFVIIFSIYYKNTKMGRYTVEGARPKAQNGNVAQNGKDSTIPMKKLPQTGICV